MSRESANDGEVKKRSFSSSGAQALEDFNQEVEDFKHLNILKSPYTDGKRGDDLLLSVREEAAVIISRIGLSTSDGKGERPNDRRKLADWYRSIFYASALLKLLRHLDPSASSSLRNSEVIQRLIDIKAGFPSRAKWLQIYQDVLEGAKIGDDKVDKNAPPQPTIKAMAMAMVIILMIVVAVDLVPALVFPSVEVVVYLAVEVLVIRQRLTCTQVVKIK